VGGIGGLSRRILFVVLAARREGGYLVDTENKHACGHCRGLLGFLRYLFPINDNVVRKGRGVGL